MNATSAGESEQMPYHHASNVADVGAAAATACDKPALHKHLKQWHLA
jgi:hypothetical protein